MAGKAPQGREWAYQGQYSGSRFSVPCAVIEKTESPAKGNLHCGGYLISSRSGHMPSWWCFSSKTGFMLPHSKVYQLTIIRLGHAITSLCQTQPLQLLKITFWRHTFSFLYYLSKASCMSQLPLESTFSATLPSREV